MSGDDTLLERIKRHDQAALAEVHEQYFDPLYNYLYYRIGDADVAADLTGEVFLALLSALEKGKPPRTSLKGWLYAVGRNLAADYIKKKIKTVPLFDNLVADNQSLTEHAHLAHMAPVLREAILQLTEEQQHVIALRFGQELSLAESAQIMDKTVGAIKALQHRALASLARLMPVEVNDDG